MSSKLLFSLTAFSLTYSLLLRADASLIDEEQFEEVAIETTRDKDDKVIEALSSSEIGIVESNRYVVFPKKNESSSENADSLENTEKQPLPKKLKPHYAGARRAPEKIKTAEDEKKNSRIKNKWFSSKTHPKVEKKENAEIKKVSALLPEDRPHYTKTGSSLLAQQDLRGDSTEETTLGMRTQTCEEQSSEGYCFPRGGFQAPSGHFYLTAAWLYWRTRQEGMEYVTAKKVEFDFQSGFRVGLGVHLPYDLWDIYVSYTRFTPHASESVRGPFYPLFLFQGTGISQGANVAQAQAHWKIEFQNVDIEIGRAFYIAKTLVFRPFFGMKGAWIDQDAKIRYEGGFIPTGQTFQTHFKNDFKGAGPLLGIQSHWLIGAGFSLFGDFAAALILGHFDNEQKQDQLDGAEVVDLNSDFNLVSPTLQLAIGVAWDRNFNRDRWHCGLSVGFESQSWGGQNQTEQFTDKDLPIYVREKGDLALYGLTLKARFDF